MNTHNKLMKDFLLKKQIKVKRTHYEKLYDNWKSGLTVGLVNLPLCISMAVASGSTPTAGILSGILAGFISGYFGGSNYSIVGPSGALSGLLSICVSKNGTGSLPYIAMATSLIILLTKMSGLEKYIDLFPVVVNEGFTVGIAFIIFFNQLNSALGIGTIKENSYVKSEDDISANLTEIIHVVETQNEETLISNIVNNLMHINQMKIQAFIIFLVFFSALYYLLKNYPKIPWMILSAILGILVGAMRLPIDTLQTKFGDMTFKLADFSYLQKLNPLFFFDPRMWVEAVPIAFVTLLETLISGKIADAMTGTVFNKQRELRGLAMSNFACGFMGGFPVTAALSRTALNVRSGSNHKYSSIINAALMFVLAAFFITQFKYLPMCVVAAQVCTVAVRMLNFTWLQHMYENDRKGFIIIMSTASIAIVKDPITGVIFGMLIYLISFCEHLTDPWTEIIMTREKVNSRAIETGVSLKEGSRSKFSLDNMEELLFDIPQQEGNFFIYRIIGILNFMNIQEHIDKISAFSRKENMTIVISLRYLHFIDHDALEALKLLFKKVEDEVKESENEIKGIKKLLITGISRSRIASIKNDQWINELQKNNILFFAQENPSK